MKNIFKSKRNILIMMFALVVIMGIGFAAYSQQLRINDTSSIDSNWNVYIKEVSVPSKTSGATGSGTVDEVEKLKAELTTDLKYPGDYVIYNITVANDGTIDAILEKINFSMEKEDTVINYYYSVDDQTTWNKVTKNGENPYNEDLLANTTDEFQVKVEYDPTKTGTATDNQKSNKLTLNLDYAQKTGSVIPSGPFAADQLKEHITTSGDGLYADEYEEGRYIYRGTNPNNYITFNGETWRVLSVETDNSIKVVKNSSIGNIPWNAEGTKSWNAPASLNTYFNDVNSNDSYYNSLSADAKKYIVEGTFNIGAVHPLNTNLSDAIANEKSLTVSNKIALVTASEYTRASSTSCAADLGTCTSSGADSNWMHSISNESFWLLTAFSSDNIIIDIVNPLGSLYYISSNVEQGVVPVIYLSDKITLSGTGTKDDPYAINS